MNIKQTIKAIPYILRSNLTPLIIGRHGTGKSQVVLNDIAKAMNCKVVEVRLGTNSDIGDLIGLQEKVYNDKGEAVAVNFLPPKWWPTEENTIVFLDEVNRARKELQQGIFQLVLGKCLNTHKLPKNCHVIAACNPATDDYVVVDMKDSAYMDRFCYIKFEPTTEEWLDYMKSKYGNNHPLISFIASEPKFLEMHGEDFSYSDIKPARRANEELVVIYNELKHDIELFKEISYGVIGLEATTAFMKYLNDMETPIDVKKVFDLDNTEVTKLTKAVKDCRGDLISEFNKEVDVYLTSLADTKELDNKITVLSKVLVYLPKEYRKTLLLTLFENPKLSNLLSDNSNKELLEAFKTDEVKVA